MDPPSRRSRRSSILKIRQTEVVLESTAVEDDQKQVLKRRVSFHNVKTVQNFEKDNLNLLDGSPFKEKIQETMSSDGILTPGRSQMTLSTPSTAASVENTNFIDDTMAVFEGVPRQRLNYDEVTSYSIADMSLGDTTVTDATEVVLDTTQALQLGDSSTVDMCFSDTISAEDDGELPKVNSNGTQYNCVDMSFSTTVNCSSRSSDDTLAALDVTCGRQNNTTNRNRNAGLFSSTKPLLGLSKRDATMDETMMVLNLRPGQSVSMFQTPSHAIHDKSSMSAYNEDTAHAFEDVAAFHNRCSDHEEEGEEMKLSSTISDGTVSGDTMAVFETLARDKESTAIDDSDMDITCATTSASAMENRSPPVRTSAESIGSEGLSDANATFVIEERFHGQSHVDLSVESTHSEQAANVTVTLVSSEKSCHTEEESCSVGASVDRDLTFTRAAGDHEETNDEQSVFKDVTTVVSMNHDSSDLKEQRHSTAVDLCPTPEQSLFSIRPEEAPALSSPHSTLLKSHLDSPGVIDRKRQRRFIDKTSETLEGEEVEEQRRADISCYQKADPIAVDPVLENKERYDAVFLSSDDGNLGDSMEIVHDDTAVSKAECTPVCDEKGDTTQLSSEGVGANPSNDDFNKTALMCDTMRTLAEQIEDVEVSVDQRDATANSSIYEILNESNVTRRDISLMQLGSRFRLSTSRDDTVLSTKSMRDETISISHRMMFDSHALQVIYANPADDQPEGNLIREQIVEELKRKLLEMQQRSECEFGVLYPKLQARDAAKALAVKNMNPRALSIDEADLLQSGRLRAEIEWANIRTEVAKQAISGIEQCLADDDPCLKELCEDAQLCGTVDELEKDVRDLEESLSGIPSADEVAQILNSYEQAVKDEEDLDCRILDKEIEALRLELQLSKLRTAELRQQNEELNHIANVLEKNEARVRGFKQQIQQFHV